MRTPPGTSQRKQGRYRTDTQTHVDAQGRHVIGLTHRDRRAGVLTSTQTDTQVDRQTCSNDKSSDRQTCSNDKSSYSMCEAGRPYLECDLSMAMRGIIIPIHIQGPDDSHPRGIHGHQDHALLLVGGCPRVSFAHEDGNLAVWVWRSTCPPLASINKVAVSLPSMFTSQVYVVCCWCPLQCLDAWTRHSYMMAIAPLSQFVQDQLEATAACSDYSTLLIGNPITWL